MMNEGEGSENITNGSYRQHTRSNEYMETSLDESEHNGSKTRGGSDSQMDRTVLQMGGPKEGTHTGLSASTSDKTPRNNPKVGQLPNSFEEERFQPHGIHLRI